jgi:hypothetical protein
VLDIARLGFYGIVFTVDLIIQPKPCQEATESVRRNMISRHISEKYVHLIFLISYIFVSSSSCFVVYKHEHSKGNF